MYFVNSQNANNHRTGGHLEERQWRFTSCAIIFLLGISAAQVRGAAIAVPDFSFENSVVADGGFTPIVAAWTETGAGSFTSGVQDSVDFQFPGTSGAGNLPGTADGQQSLLLRTNRIGLVSRTTALPVAIIAANTTYTLTVAIGVSLDFPGAGNTNGTATDIALLANESPFSIRIIDTNITPRGTFVDYTTSFTTDAGSALIGQALKLRIGALSGGTFPGEFKADNVRLDATALPGAPVIPEPSSALFAVALVASIGFCRRDGTNSDHSGI